ncbi:MAG: MoaD/ThiS family protein, partial [Planctomycetota bacterium]
ARTVRDALEAVFQQNRSARGYVLDDQGAARKHIAIFVGGRPIRDRETLSDPLEDGDEVYVMQALSGG